MRDSSFPNVVSREVHGTVKEYAMQMCLDYLKLSGMTVVRRRRVDLKAIPPSYAPSGSPSGGKPLTNHQRAALAIAILAILLVVIFLMMQVTHGF